MPWNLPILFCVPFTGPSLSLKGDSRAMAAGKMLPVRILLSAFPLILLASCCGASHHQGLTAVSAHTDEPLAIHKMGGDIDVKEAPQGAHLETMGGNIHLGSVDSAAKLHTMGGSITVDRAS